MGLDQSLGGEGKFDGTTVKLGLLFGAGGFAIGGLIASTSIKKFTIKGKKSALKEMNATLLERVYRR